ncbi:MAG: CDP-diacylglycerol--serine O-phosphatidyltransferase [Thermoanaerobaculia bacterium]|jgi:CDP-diacylglycerol--serine O-phosphatidyltransferase|nr:CDP-diacylglycerol--serine O-phosphatidyltransferase [Thermoanaerobaculia bacterium]
MNGTSSEVQRRGVRRGVYVIPALFTVGNVFCGYLSLMAAVRGRYDLAAGLIFLAGFLDSLDGRVARMTGSTSAFGEQLDSLSDVLSFGLAPAFLVFHWGLSTHGRLGLFASFLFLVCGACRLARFNVQIHVVDKRWFVGLPIPAAAGALCGLIWVIPEPLSDPRIATAFLGVTLVLGFLMVSTFRYRSFKDVDLRSRRSMRLVPLLGLVIAAVAAWRPDVCLASLAVVYALSAPTARLVSVLFPRRAPAEEGPA